MVGVLPFGRYSSTVTVLKNISQRGCFPCWIMRGSHSTRAMIESHVASLLCLWKFPVTPCSWVSRLSKQIWGFSVLNLQTKPPESRQSRICPMGMAMGVPRWRAQWVPGGEHSTLKVPSSSLCSQVAMPLQTRVTSSHHLATPQQPSKSKQGGHQSPPSISRWALHIRRTPNSMGPEVIKTCRNPAAAVLITGVDLGQLSPLSGEQHGLPPRENIKEQQRVGEEALPAAWHADPSPSCSQASLPQQVQPNSQPSGD